MTLESPTQGEIDVVEQLYRQAKARVKVAHRAVKAKREAVYADSGYAWEYDQWHNYQSREIERAEQELALRVEEKVRLEKTWKLMRHRKREAENELTMPLIRTLLYAGDN